VTIGWDLRQVTVQSGRVLNVPPGPAPRAQHRRTQPPLQLMRSRNVPCHCSHELLLRRPPRDPCSPIDRCHDEAIALSMTFAAALDVSKQNSGNDLPDPACAARSVFMSP
jgi:hypothetical protein